VNWTEILARAGIPEPPGREEAIAAAREATAARYAKDGGPKRARGSATRTVSKWSRAAKREAERKEKLRKGR
jgi:hypothetical protein